MVFRWQGVIAIEGEATGDGRMIERGALWWEDGPWPLIWDREEGDHSAAVVGQTDRIWRDGDLIMAEGILHESEDEATQAAVNRVVELLTPTEGSPAPAVGVSVSLDHEDAEIRISADAMEEIDDDDILVAATDASVRTAVRRDFQEDGEPPDAEPIEVGDTDDEGRTVVARWKSDEELYVVTSARVRHVAIVDTAAFADARITVTASGITVTVPRIALTASVAPDLFANPGFGHDGAADPRLVRQSPERPGERVAWGAPLTVEDVVYDDNDRVVSGRLFGHAALHGRCHAGFADRCVPPPSEPEFSRFLHGAAVPGVRTGPVTIGTTHADMEMSAREAMNHYADTGRAVADVAVGTDAHGIWAAGRLRRGTSRADVEALQGSSLSGDWRPIGGRRRLIGLLAVNSPGFLVERNARSEDAMVATITAGPCACGDEALVAALGEGQTGATVMLLPSAADAERLALEGYEAADTLHVTLAWMGQAADLSDEARELALEVAGGMTNREPFTADAFAVAVFNQASEERDASLNLLVQASELAELHGTPGLADLDASDFPVWFPHLCLAYGMPVDEETLAAAAERLGPITFDRLAVAFGEDVVVLELGGGAADDADLEARVGLLEQLAGEMMLRDVAAEQGGPPPAGDGASAGGVAAGASRSLAERIAMLEVLTGEQMVRSTAQQGQDQTEREGTHRG